MKLMNGDTSVKSVKVGGPGRNPASIVNKTFTFENVPKYDESGSVIEYTVQLESVPNNYVVTYS